MAFAPNFSASQSPQDPNSFELIDTSTGSDAAIVNRNISLQLYNGEYMASDGVVSTDSTPIPFPLGDDTIDFTDVLSIDYSISVTMRWLDSGGGTLYSLSQTFCFKENGEDFDYGLTQDLSGNIGLLQDTNYIMNRFRFRMYLEAANNAVLTGNDIAGSQMMLDLATAMNQNEADFF